VAYVVLGIAATRGPTTPYEFKKYVATSIGYFWPLSHMALHREPRRLTELGLLTARQEQNGRRRTFYAITERGTEVLRGWLRTAAAQPPQLRDEGLLKLHFSGSISEPEVRELALSQLAIRRERLALFERLRDKYGELPDHQHQNQTLEAGFAFERAYIAFWSDITTIEESHDAGHA
jgi:DNA-binding PadR family transcriptional regulator